jgi:hypothetical protein
MMSRLRKVGPQRIRSRQYHGSPHAITSYLFVAYQGNRVQWPAAAASPMQNDDKL